MSTVAGELSIDPPAAALPASAASLTAADFIKLMVEQKIFAASIAAAAQRLRAETRQPLDLAICSLGAIREEALADWFASTLNWRRYTAKDPIDEAVAKRVQPGFLRRSRAFPLRIDEGCVLIAIADPADDSALRGCRFAFNAPVQALIATASELERLISTLFEAEAQGQQISDDYLIDDADKLRDVALAEPVIRLCNRLIGDAERARASDIHLEAGERDYRARFRIDGALSDQGSFSRKEGLAAVSRFKILSNLDIAERRRPQDGRFTFVSGGHPIDLRVATTPSVHGENMALRLLTRDAGELDLEALGFDEIDSATLHALSDRPNGILLLTGPTGSGKTTTLYALLRRLAGRDLKILTIEDPVEYKIDGVSQTQVNPAIGLTFASALRSFLRHDPDVIMVGEMRDLETARTAIQAALTGHLVLSTLHTNDAPSAVTRLLDMGVEDYLVSSTLLGVVAQRLVRKRCSACTAAKTPRLVGSDPCEACGGSGFRGRLAVAEVLSLTEKTREAIKAGVTSATLTASAQCAGFRSMKVDGETKAARGLTTAEEVRRAVGS